MSSFDQNLRRLRLRRNMKQEDLAEQMHVSRQTVSGWETGRRQPDLETLKKLAEVLDVDIHELIYGNKPGQYPQFQRKYRIRTAAYGGTIAVLLLFRLLVLPWFKRLCATYHWGEALFICHEILPVLWAFSLGALLPSVVQLLVPVRMKKGMLRCCISVGLIALSPAGLLWLGELPLSTWVLYTVGHSLVTYILPFVSGVCMELGLTCECAEV